MADIQIAKQMKWHVVIVDLQADHSDLEIIGFFKVAWYFVFKIGNQLQNDKGNGSQTAKSSHMIRKDDFIQDVQQTIDNKPRKSMKSFRGNNK